jgi:hypothetical protein
MRRIVRPRTYVAQLKDLLDQGVKRIDDRNHTGSNFAATSHTGD